MSRDRRLALGKLPPELLGELLATSPPLPAEVRLGPAVGEDACAIAVSEGILVAATDPITLTGAGVGAHAVFVNANDVAVLGVRPRWFLATVLLPEGVRESEVRALFVETQRALADLDVALVGGHTEVTAAVRQTVVVGQMLGHSPDGRFLSTGGASPGETLVQIGPAPIEGAVVLATEAAGRLESFDPDVLEAARQGLVTPGILVVDAALEAADLGATALHDPTESGLSGGLYELAHASGVRIAVNPDAVLWFEPGVEICRSLGADPWGTLASGCVLATFPASRVADACSGLEKAGHRSAVLGTLQEGTGVTLGVQGELQRFDRDEVARVLDPPG